jgi:gamma-glutamylcyclotransferase (GGCT)/AIG2-like uncharacterized protein YtfP
MKTGDLVAVYGSLRKGLGNHPVIEGAECKGNTIIKGWDLYSLGAYPFVVEGENELTVEVYEVDSEMRQRRLDGLEGYPNFYDRIQVDTEFGKAWIYFMHEKYTEGAPLVEHGDWTKYKAA